MTLKNVIPSRLSRKQAADYIGYEPGTLDKWACKGINLKYYIEDGRTFYELMELDAFERSQQTF